ncbi:MAG: GNAT family N-acetyltransferase [Candidatus Sulfotelmatobacter sp.]
MVTELEAVTFSEIDSARFGVRVARAHVVPENLRRVLESCTAEKIDLLIARCPTSDLATAQDMEKHGFSLMDTLVYYRFDLAKRAVPEDKGEFPVRGLRPGDEEQVRMVASAAFKGYIGHYHADRRLDRRRCDEGYVSWAERSCIPKTAADEVLVAEHGDRVVGFATLRLNSPQEVEGLLYAVAPEWQGRGICRSFMIRSLQWCRSRGAQRMIISTQVTNVSMQKVWCRVGFEPSHSYYTFHKWFDR